MSDKELRHIDAIQAVREKRLGRRDAAIQPGLTGRQARRRIEEGKTVGNKRAGMVLKRAQGKMDELDRQDRRNRSQSMPGRRIPVCYREPFRGINPVSGN